MYEQKDSYNQSESAQKQQANHQLISIRKKLVEPNNLLPACMIRSQQPQHILPIRTEREFQSGQRLPLDQVGYESDVQPSLLVKTFKSKKYLSRSGKNRSKSQLPQFKKKEQYKISQEDRPESMFEASSQILQFLNKNIKNIFDFAEKIVFISHSAFLCNIRSGKYKNKGQEAGSQEKRKAQYLKYLKNNQYFGSIAYAYDQQNQQEYKSLEKSVNEDEYLQFQDDFQSSNLYIAMRCDYELMNAYKKAEENYNNLYFLTVRLDYNTKSYGQWFYFKIKRKDSHYTFSRTGGKSYKFMIINMTKNSSLFGKGLKISVCRNGIWGKEGSNIKYYKNSLRREEIFTDNDQQSPLASLKSSPQHFYTLQFTLDLVEGEQIYVSYNQPYSYSRVGKLLDKITAKYEENQHNMIDLKRNIICSTYLNNNIQVITFSAKKQIPQPLHISIQEKKVIFIMGRTHPIQTAGSHVIEGILNEIYKLFIQNPRDQNRSHIIFKLLQQYIIKIIPMVNPDGVILGNSRCNLTGYDLNRCWKSPKFQKSKEIFYIKRHIFQYQKRIDMFIDLHAHSKKKNVFAYGCHDMSNPFSTREFPYLLSKLSKNDFLFQECRFTKLNELKVQVNQKKSTKDGTARIFLYDSLRIPNIFTIQNSYCSAKNSIYHYDNYSYGIIGADILKAISLYFSPHFKPTDNDLLFEKNRDVQEKIRPSNQSHIQISLNTTFRNDLQLKLTINSDRTMTYPTQPTQSAANTANTAKIHEEMRQYRNPDELREKYLAQLRQKQENIKIGLIKDNDVSQSQQEERIYETVNRKKQKNSSQAMFSRKVRGESKTDRLVHYLNKNTVKQSPVKSSINKKSVLNISSTHSQTNLAQITKINKNRFHTLTKNEETVLIPDQNCHQNYSREKRLPLSRRKRLPTQMESSRKEKMDNCLSIVEIGLGTDIQKGHIEEKVTIIDRFDTKERLKTFHGFRDQKALQSQQSRKLQGQRQLQLKDDEIKEYLRRIMKPKQLIQKRQRTERLYRLHQKSQLAQQRLKQSQLQFTDTRFSKLVILQNNKQILEGE